MLFGLFNKNDGVRVAVSSVIRVCLVNTSYNCNYFYLVLEKTITRTIFCVGTLKLRTVIVGQKHSVESLLMILIIFWWLMIQLINQNQTKRRMNGYLKSYWCEYGKLWEKVKDKYGLRYSNDERITLNQLAETCLE